MNKEYLDFISIVTDLMNWELDHLILIGFTKYENLRLGLLLLLDIPIFKRTLFETL